jgi:hypothetical protein
MTTKTIGETFQDKSLVARIRRWSWRQRRPCRHKWDGVIVGFSQIGHAIGRCTKCGDPIVSEKITATPFLLSNLYGKRGGMKA